MEAEKGAIGFSEPKTIGRAFSLVLVLMMISPIVFSASYWDMYPEYNGNCFENWLGCFEFSGKGYVDDPYMAYGDNVNVQFTIEIVAKLDNTWQMEKYLLQRGHQDYQYGVIYGYSAENYELYCGGCNGDNPRPYSKIHVNDTNWHSIAYTYDGTTFSSYLDGKKANSEKISFTLPKAGNGTIGGAQDYTGRPTGLFMGKIALVPNTYDYPLSETEVRQHYGQFLANGTLNSIVPPPQPPPKPAIPAPKPSQIPAPQPRQEQPALMSFFDRIKNSNETAICFGAGGLVLVLFLIIIARMILPGVMSKEVPASPDAIPTTVQKMETAAEKSKIGGKKIENAPQTASVPSQPIGTPSMMLIVAAIIVVMIVVVSVVGGLMFMFTPGPGDTKKTQSDAYWRGEARPFAVLEHSQTGNNLSLILQNVEAEQRIIENVSVGGQGRFGIVKPVNSTRVFSPGEKRRYDIVFFEGAGCAPGTTYEYRVNITYSNAGQSLTGNKQVGAKTLVGKCW